MSKRWHARVQERYKLWANAVAAKLQELQGWQTARLLEVERPEAAPRAPHEQHDGAGRLKAYFNSDLVGVVNDVRQLRSLGFAVPGNVEDKVKVCTRGLRTSRTC